MVIAAAIIFFYYFNILLKTNYLTINTSKVVRDNY